MPPVRFHLSLNVADLAASVAFYRTLFGLDPAKHRPDYAKFEPAEPPLVLSLEPGLKPVGGGALNHLGLRLPDSAALVAVQARLEAAGMPTNREDGVECCYAKQSKFWLTDPDGTLWELYTLEADLDHKGPGQSLEVMRPAAKVAPVVWEHRLGEPVPDGPPVPDGSADEVRLRGSFNVPLPAAEQSRLVGAAVRALRPGGRVFVHTLVADRPTDAAPGLPGPAAAVRHTPLSTEPSRLLAAAGLERVTAIKFGADPCFVRNGVQMREQQLEAFKPAAG